MTFVYVQSTMPSSNAFLTPQEAIARQKQMEEDKQKQVKELAKQLASLSAERAEIMRKLERAQAELFRKAKEKERNACVSGIQVNIWPANIFYYRILFMIK
jgi:uncharacterized protein YPO0396